MRTQNVSHFEQRSQSRCGETRRGRKSTCKRALDASQCGCRTDVHAIAGPAHLVHGARDEVQWKTQFCGADTAVFALAKKNNLLVVQQVENKQATRRRQCDDEAMKWQKVRCAMNTCFSASRLAAPRVLVRLPSKMPKNMPSQQKKLRERVRTPFRKRGNKKKTPAS